MKKNRGRAERLRPVFIAMAALLVGSLAATFWSSRNSLEVADRVVVHDRVINRMQQTFSALQDAETGQRGYLLTADVKYLLPYQRAVDVIPGHMAELSVAVNRELAPADLTVKLQQRVSAKLDELGRTVSLAKSGGHAAAMNVVNTDVGLRAMDDVREIFDDLLDDQRRRRSKAAEAAQRAEQMMTAVFVVVVFANLGFLLWAYRRLREEIRRTDEADSEARRQRETLAVSLASIGDAVILTDMQGNVTFLNAMAEDLTGWKAPEAIGQPCSRIFHIINESSRAEVPSPVARVLETGRVVGLANHTLLLRRDGTEVPIDDSGAPIRSENGEIRGVVLVFRDFSEHKESERVLIEVTERLEAANKAKDDFLAALSHELRTPLTPVLATLSSWESQGNLPAAMADEVRMLTRNVSTEVRLIDDLLDFTRIMRGRLSMRSERVDMHQLLDGVVAIRDVEIDGKGIRVGRRFAAANSVVDGDRARLQQVFWNVLGNAIKFTPNRGRIEIVTADDGDFLRVDVVDNGRGMSREILDRLFQPFEHSAKEIDVSRPAGLGIGLTLAQGLAKAHGGRIEARSDGVNLGSTFTIRLPVATSASGEVSATNGATNAEPASSRLRILLVEDHEDTAVVLARLISGLGHEVDSGDSVASAIFHLRSKTYDLVLSDIGLPDGDGIELLKQARAFCSTPVIAVTGYGREDDIARFREAGFFDQMTKPIRFDQLVDCLRRFEENRNRGAL